MKIKCRSSYLFLKTDQKLAFFSKLSTNFPFFFLRYILGRYLKIPDFISICTLLKCSVCRAAPEGLIYSVCLITCEVTNAIYSKCCLILPTISTHFQELLVLKSSVELYWLPLLKQLQEFPGSCSNSLFQPWNFNFSCGRWP